MFIIFEQFIFSFIASFAFGIMFNVPRRALFWCGLIGASGWLSYWSVSQLTDDVAISNFIGALVIGGMCFYFSKKLRIPVIILNTPALVPLVPGGPAYMAVRVTVEGNYIEAVGYFMDVLWTAGAIVFGFMVIKIVEMQFKKLKFR